MRVFLAVLLAFFLVGCESKKDEKLVISCNSWIGYSPLYYANEMGWLDKLNIKLINVVSLSESKGLYNVGKSDAFTGTQYEYSLVKREDKTLFPLILLDRSFGGDMIFSNKSIEQLQNSQSKIDAYLEIDSVNNLLLHYFIKKYNIDKTRINYINKDQAVIANLREKDLSSKNVLIVTYSPYDRKLKANGFKEVACTKNGVTLVVVDALYANKKTFQVHKQQFIALKKAIDDAIDVLHKDPKKYYNVVQPYLRGYTYEDYEASLNEVKWINKKVSKELVSKLDSIEFPIKNIIR